MGRVVLGLSIFLLAYRSLRPALDVPVTRGLIKSVLLALGVGEPVVVIFLARVDVQPALHLVMAPAAQLGADQLVMPFGVGVEPDGDTRCCWEDRYRWRPGRRRLPDLSSRSPKTRTVS